MKFDLISLELSAECALRCSMCSLNRYYSDKGYMSAGVIDRVLPALGRFERLDFGTTGETFQHPEFLKILATIRAEYPELLTHAVTNAMHFDERTCERIVELGLHTISVSLDAASAKTYHKIRIGGDYSKVLAGISRLGRVKARRGSGFPYLNSTFTASGRNYRELPAFIDLASSLEIREVHVNNIEVYHEADLKQSLYFYPPDDLADVIALTKELARTYEIDLRLPAFEVGELPPCRYIVVGVTKDGDVVPCAALMYNREYFDLSQQKRMYQKRIFGNLHYRTLDEICASPDFTEWFEPFDKGEYHNDCKDCVRRFGVICG
ncbi:MAG: radical SAM protein [Planctomycetes bacterium]|nr:radical SAM protein [Planctomycetota bacterium]